MPAHHRPERRVAPPPPPPLPPAFAAALTAYLTWMQTVRRTPSTIQARARGVRRFAAWCAARGVLTPGAVTFDHGEQYAAHVEAQVWRGRAGRAGLARTTRVNLLGDVRMFYAWASRHGHAAGNPLADVDGPPAATADPRPTLRVAEVERLMAVPDPTTLLGLRDRAMLEVLYSTGLRRAELLGLTPADVYADGVVRVLDGKGRRDRLVPIGARALAWVDRYRHEARPPLDPSGIAVELFIARGGLPLCPAALDRLLAAYLRAASITTPGGCHLLRHTCATLLLEGGASLDAVRRILGHAQARTTVGYTHPSLAALRRAWARSHPAASTRDAVAASAPMSALPVAAPRPAPMPPLDGGVSPAWLAWWRLRQQQHQQQHRQQCGGAP
jgi:integrase/recombinase XerD